MSEILQRFGLIGDVHGEDAFLATALERLSREHVDRILCVGDIADGRGDVDCCVELLDRHRVDCVRGNHDRWLVHDQERDLHDATVLDDLAPHTQWYLAHLPATRRYETVAGPMLLCHGIGKDDMAFIHDGRSLRERGQQGVGSDILILVGGHTHKRVARRAGRLTVINAGTLRAGDTPCFSVVDLAAQAVQFFDLDEDGKIIEAERVLLSGSNSARDASPAGGPKRHR